jgi:hypothetical protein
LGLSDHVRFPPDSDGNLLVVVVAYPAVAPPTAAQLAGGVVILAGVLCSQLAGRALAREPREVAAP